MNQTVSDFFWERLHQWGVRRVFGYPGDGDDGLMEALNKAGDKFEFVQVRHEEMAAFMASAHAKFTGELGVCIATSGPGASHLITGLYDAALDHMPVLAIAGQSPRTAIGGHFQQEVDLVSMYKDVAGAFVHQVSVPAQVPHLIDRAVRIALAERRVTALVFPKDVQALKMQQPPRKSGTLHSGVGYTKPKIVPYAEDLRRAERLVRGLATEQSQQFRQFGLEAAVRPPPGRSRSVPPEGGRHVVVAAHRRGDEPLEARLDPGHVGLSVDDVVIGLARRPLEHVEKERCHLGIGQRPRGRQDLQGGISRMRVQC